LSAFLPKIFQIPSARISGAGALPLPLEEANDLAVVVDVNLERRR
jgi:hypothetical protein